MSNFATEIYINNLLVNDQLDAVEDAATILAGISLSWGRGSPLDQPSTSTLQASLLLPEARAAALIDEISPGSPILVRTHYTAPPENKTEINGSTNLYAEGATKSGTTEATLVSIDPAMAPVDAYTPPGPIQPEGTNTEAWDNLGRAGRAGRYTLSQMITLPPNTSATLHAVYYSRPWASATTVSPPLATRATSGLLHAAITIPAAQIGKWVGILVRIQPIGPAWSQLTASWSITTRTWQSLATIAIGSQTLTRLDSALYDATVFEGRISDSSVAWDDAARRPRLDLAAVDFTADLANQYIGEDPWPEETALSRALRLRDLAREQVALAVDEPAAQTMIARRDVDNQPIMRLLEDLATTTGTVLWPITHAATGPALQFEDPGNRAALYRLIIPATGPATLDIKATGATRLPSSLFPRSGPTISKAPGEIATIAAVQWATVTVEDGKLNREEHTTTTTNPALLDQIGPRTISVTTDLVSDADAHALAVRALALASPAGWMLDNLTWDTSLPGSEPLAILNALDATRRVGLPLILTDLPEWIPGAPAIPVYLDGGHYTHNGKAWILDLTTIKAAYPAASIQWGQAPPPLTWTRGSALTWNDIALATP